MSYPDYTTDITHCRALHKFHGKSYYFATRFFPKHLREATWILYAFFRVPDEIVDNPTHTKPEEITTALDSWIDEWRRVYHGAETTDPVLRATKHVFDTYHIPYEYSESFLTAMKADITVSRYQNYRELEYYMYGSAAVVGLMMTHIIGFSEPRTLPYAKALGEAMQLTNFLRDISDDYITRNRIYLPAKDMEQFDVTEQTIKQKKVTPQFVSLMKYEIDRARSLYTESEKGIPLLHPHGRFAVWIARVLYSEILTEIEHANYDIFSKRVRVSGWKKLWLVVNTYPTYKHLQNRV